MERSVACGDVAHLGERSVRIAEVRGSSPLVSTNHITLTSAEGRGFLFAGVPRRYCAVKRRLLSLTWTVIRCPGTKSVPSSTTVSTKR